ncbi:MAG: hypothetical protein ACOYL6_08705 [Bacteriovoracaceae bacterium]
MIVNFSYASSVPNLLGEGLKKPNIEKVILRVKAIIEHQNAIRRIKKLPLLINLEQVNLDQEGVTTVMSNGNIGISSGVSIIHREDMAFISEFDDAKFLNYAYFFSSQNTLEKSMPLAVYATSRIDEANISFFRLMDQFEYDLWKNKDLATLRAWEGLPGPPQFRYWGFDAPITHTSPFVIWETGRISVDEPCGQWKVPTDQVIKWANEEKITFGLTGKVDSKEYEYILLESSWDDLISYPFKSCYEK